MSGAVLVTGAGGMLGGAVAAAARAARAPGPIHAAPREALDILDPHALEEYLSRLRPAVIINCAAWADVDGAEADPRGAHAVNATGAGNVARAAGAVGARVVHVSTDYVFDGCGVRPYLESDAVGPRSVYGASKLAGEHEVLAAGPEHAVVRTAWLFGGGGRNFVDTMLGIGGEREEVAVVVDQRGCPTWTGHLAPALLALAASPQRGVLHVAGAGQCTWNELAREVFTQAGLEVRVLQASSAEQNRRAPRPPYSVLASERPDAPRLPDWREGVRGHLSALGRLGAGGLGAGATAGQPR